MFQNSRLLKWLVANFVFIDWSWSSRLREVAVGANDLQAESSCCGVSQLKLTRLHISILWLLEIRETYLAGYRLDDSLDLSSDNVHFKHCWSEFSTIWLLEDRWADNWIGLPLWWFSRNRKSRCSQSHSMFLCIGNLAARKPVTKLA